jgi:hypothetical protein
MDVITPEFVASCRMLLERYFAAFPDGALQNRTQKALQVLLDLGKPLKGKAEAWAGGIVYAVGSRGVGVSGVLNREFEAVFGMRMTTIYKYAAKVQDLLGTSLPSPLEGLSLPEPFTLRDEANAMCAYAFRNGFIEDIHASGRITDEEMKRLMIQASASLAKLLTRKQESPAEYDQFIRDYNQKFCRGWER